MKKLGLLFMAFMVGCASTHPGYKATKVSGPGEEMIISANPVAEYTDKYNMVIDFTIENPTSRWVRIDKVELEFPNVDGVVHNIIVGNDLKMWAESYANKKRRDDHNAEIGLAAAVLGGLTIAILGARNGSNSFTSLGLVTAAAGSGIHDIRKIEQARLNAQTSTTIPENYILAPLTVPSQGFLRRWVLLNLPQGLIAKKATLKLTTVEGEVSKYEVPISDLK